MDTRTSILHAAAEVFAQHGFRGSTTRRIAEAAAVNEVTIFRYFGSKDALLQEAISTNADTVFANPLPKKPVNPERELGDWCGSVMEHLYSRRGMIRKCMGELEERPDMTKCAARAPTMATGEVCAYFETLKREGFTSEEFDAMAAASMLRGALFHDALGREMMPNIYPEPVEEAPARYAQLVLRAIGVRTNEKDRSNGSSTPPAHRTETKSQPDA